MRAMSQSSGKVICGGSGRRVGRQFLFAGLRLVLLLLLAGGSVRCCCGQSERGGVPDDLSEVPRLLFSSPFSAEPVPFLRKSPVGCWCWSGAVASGAAVRAVAVDAAAQLEQVSWDEYLQFSGSGSRLRGRSVAAGMSLRGRFGSEGEVGGVGVLPATRLCWSVAVFRKGRRSPESCGGCTWRGCGGYTSG
ncbi:MAG UNVERIFIED_CONTAM: hypothetical protein LVR18_48425 [Planctomycetaceae bacterium]|jgi:hypothetical protein